MLHLISILCKQIIERHEFAPASSAGQFCNTAYDAPKVQNEVPDLNLCHASISGLLRFMTLLYSL